MLNLKQVNSNCTKQTRELHLSKQSVLSRLFITVAVKIFSANKLINYMIQVLPVIWSIEIALSLRIGHDSSI